MSSNKCGNVHAILHETSNKCGNIRAILHETSNKCGNIHAILHETFNKCGNIHTLKHREMSDYLEYRGVIYDERLAFSDERNRFLVNN